MVERANLVDPLVVKGPWPYKESKIIMKSSFGNSKFDKEHWLQIYPPPSYWDHMVIWPDYCLGSVPSYFRIRFVGSTDLLMTTSKCCFGAILF
jgi:hypothetical protein